jgi:hypothetical protein
MPSPVSNSSSPPSLCDPTLASCLEAEPSAAAAVKSPPVVTIAPVHIQGDAGTRELVRRLADPSPPCLPARHAVLDGAESIGLGIATTVAGAATAWGAAAGILSTFRASRQTGEALASQTQCEDRVTDRAEIVADCEARGGEVQSQSEGEVVCLVPKR